MANSWILTVVFLLSIFGPGSHTRGEDIVQQNQDDVIEGLRDFREQIFMAGSDATLWCASNVTDVKWNELIFIVWNISMRGRKCFLGLSPKLDNTCDDGKRLDNTSNGVSLFIPKISVEDEGFYYCDLSIKGKSTAVNVSVSVTRLETDLVSEKGQRIAVCKATYKKTAPTLHWEPALNFSSKNASGEKADTFFIENRVNLPDDVTISNLSCVALYPSVSGSLQQKSTLHITTPGIQFCLRKKEETTTQGEMKKYGG